MKYTGWCESDFTAHGYFGRQLPCVALGPRARVRCDEQLLLRELGEAAGLDRLVDDAVADGDA